MSMLQMIDFWDVAFEMCQEKDELFKNRKLADFEFTITEDTYLHSAKEILVGEREDISKRFGDILKILGVGMFRGDFQIKGTKNVKYIVPEDEVSFLKDLLTRYAESKVWKRYLKDRQDKVLYDMLGKYRNLSVAEKLEVTEELKETVIGLIRMYTKIQKYKLENLDHELPEHQMLERREEFITCIYRENSFVSLVALESSYKKYEKLLFWGLENKTETELDYQLETDLVTVLADLANEMTEILDKSLKRIQKLFLKRKMEYALNEILYAIPEIKELNNRLSIECDKEVALHEENLSARKRYQNRGRLEIVKENILKSFRDEFKSYDEKTKDGIIEILAEPMTIEEIEQWNPVMNYEENLYLRAVSEVTTIDELLSVIEKYEGKVSSDE